MLVALDLKKRCLNSSAGRALPWYLELRTNRQRSGDHNIRAISLKRISPLGAPLE